jgi:AraC family transcriptional regulator
VRLRKVNTLELVRRAKEYLAGYQLQSPLQPARLSQTARALGASSSALASAFRTLEKTSFYRYALNLRLARAATLLPASNDLARLASDLGFASHSHFSTAFHRWAGRTPSAYRAEAFREGSGAIRPELALVKASARIAAAQ